MVEIKQTKRLRYPIFHIQAKGIVMSVPTCQCHVNSVRQLCIRMMSKVNGLVWQEPLQPLSQEWRLRVKMSSQLLGLQEVVKSSLQSLEPVSFPTATLSAKVKRWANIYFFAENLPAADREPKNMQKCLKTQIRSCIHKKSNTIFLPGNCRRIEQLHVE